jgi:hypothetical protein
MSGLSATRRGSVTAFRGLFGDCPNPVCLDRHLADWFDADASFHGHWPVARGDPGISPPNLDDPVPLRLVGPPAVPFGFVAAAEPCTIPI